MAGVSVPITCDRCRSLSDLTGNQGDALGISVVIPTYNRRESLLRAIDSVATADPSRVEIVVVDDGSAIDARSFVRLVNAHGIPVRCFRQQRNRGPQAARNLGIRRARYPYVAFLDSDDTFRADKVDRVMAELASGRIDLLFHAVSGMKSYNVLGALWSRYLSFAIPFRWLAAVYNPAPTPGLVIRRMRRLGAPRLTHCEDYFFLLRYASSEIRVRYIHDELSSVCRAPGTGGGLSESAWRMRVGEFAARRALLKERRFSNCTRFLVGTAVGVARVASDLIRGRYFG
ncbi:glycosyltransferase family 2 protein [Anaeromyxobacter terrae]|uniref:glycosyltransferase family 2 protein n=1 Tax=Anaeromyxobacter terrae TaxID=2925406 RepID=UPI00243693A1|nr:glycosyltransferase family 2 protein [Anaeromyxobacter sp. SG22]